MKKKMSGVLDVTHSLFFFFFAARANLATACSLAQQSKQFTTCQNLLNAPDGGKKVNLNKIKMF